MLHHAFKAGVHTPGQCARRLRNAVAPANASNTTALGSGTCTAEPKTSILRETSVIMVALRCGYRPSAPVLSV